MADLMKTPGHADLKQGIDQEHIEKSIPVILFLFLSLLIEGIHILEGMMEILLEQ